MEAGEVSSLGETYDFDSIMHYARNTFSRSESMLCLVCVLLWLRQVWVGLLGAAEHGSLPAPSTVGMSVLEIRWPLGCGEI